MSVSVLREGDNQGLNFAKGADVTIKDKLASNGEAEKSLFSDLDSYAE